MHKYRIEYLCNDGYCGEEEVYAANRMAAMMIFEDFGYTDVISIDCYRVEDEDEDEEQ